MYISYKRLFKFAYHSPLPFFRMLRWILVWFLGRWCRNITALVQFVVLSTSAPFLPMRARPRKHLATKSREDFGKVFCKELLQSLPGPNYRGGHIVMTVLQNAVQGSQSSASLENPFPVESSIELGGFPATCAAWSKKNYSSPLYKYYTCFSPQWLFHAIKHRGL